MTKMRSKKMTKSTFAVIIMAILMVAMLAFGGTYAYFTAKTEGLGGSISTGTLTVETGDTAQIAMTNVHLVPNQIQEVINTSEITFKGTTVSAYRINFKIDSIKVGGAGEDIKATLIGDGKDNFITIDVLSAANVTLVSATDSDDAAWYDGGDGYFYYNTVSAPTAAGKALDTMAPKVAIKLDANAGNSYQNLTIAYTVVVEAAQAEYVDASTSTAYTEGTVLTKTQVTGLTSWSAMSQDNA